MNNKKKSATVFVIFTCSYDVITKKAFKKKRLVICPDFLLQKKICKYRKRDDAKFLFCYSHEVIIFIFTAWLICSICGCWWERQVYFNNGNTGRKVEFEMIRVTGSSNATC